MRGRRTELDYGHLYTPISKEIKDRSRNKTRINIFTQKNIDPKTNKEGTSEANEDDRRREVYITHQKLIRFL